MLHTPSLARRHAQRLLLSLLACCVLVSILVAQAIGSTGQVDRTPLAAQTDAAGGAAATVEQCVTTGEQTDRSATFSAEMTAVDRHRADGDADRSAGADARRRTLSHRLRPGPRRVARLGARGEDLPVRQAGHQPLSAGGYRALVRFHWLNDKGYVIKRAERHTLECVQPASVTAPAPVTPATPGGSTAGSTAPSTTTG